MKKGFTLIEIQGIMIILSILILISAASIVEILRKSEEKTTNILNQIIYESATDMIETNPTVYRVYKGNKYCLKINDIITGGYLDATKLDTEIGGKINREHFVQVEVLSRSKFKYEIKPGCGSEIYHTFDGFTNRPQIAQGMTPIKWDGTKWVKTTISDADWYNYEKKEFANAISADCTDINNPESCSMWTWIPRFAYSIRSNYNQSGRGSIDVKFLKGDSNIADGFVEAFSTPIYNGSIQTNYIVHPAFVFDSEQILGFWAAKFIATASEGVSGTIADNNPNKTVKIIPGAPVWNGINLSNAFDASSRMKYNSIYGFKAIEADTHLLKNRDWGAIAYLMNSQYGTMNKIINDATVNCFTGGGNATYYQYNFERSSNGNITGVYDIYSPCSQMVSSYYAQDVIGNTVNPLVTSHANSLLLAPLKYKDLIVGANGEAAATVYTNNRERMIGTAMYETGARVSTTNESWFSGGTGISNYANPSVYRGGRNGTGLYSPFSTFELLPSASTAGFRPVIIVQK